MRTNVKRNILVFITLFTLIIAAFTGFFITRSKVYAETLTGVESAKTVTANYVFYIKDSAAEKTSSFDVPMRLSNEHVVMRVADPDREEKEDYYGCEFTGTYSNLNTWCRSTFNKELTADQNFEFTWYNEKFIRDLPCIEYNFAYDYSEDVLTVKITIAHAASKFMEYDPFTNVDSSALKVALGEDLRTASDALANNFNMMWDLKYKSQDVASVTFHYWDGFSKWRNYEKIYHVGETPVFPDELRTDYHKRAFRRWYPEVTAVSSTEPIVYTADYRNPTLDVTDADGNITSVSLKYGLIDNDLLFTNFTSKFKDVGAIESVPIDEIKFKNRVDFWYTVRSNSATVHTVDTNMTLEAISYQFHKKGTDVYLSFKNAEELFGTNEVNWNYFWYSVKNGGAADSPSWWERTWNSFMRFSADLVCGVLGIPTAATASGKTKEELLADFTKKYYPEAVLQAPDEYELVYVYYYSVELAESGEKATLTYNDEYKKSVLKVKNNLDDTVAEYPFCYDLERGCYFQLPMDSYWMHMNKVSSKKAEFYGGSDEVKAEVSDARFSISGFDGTVEYDKELADNLELALTSYVYLYTETLSPDYKDEYTVTVNFTDYTVIHEDETDNIGSVVDNAGDKISGWWNDVKDKLGNTWKWVKIVFWIVVGIIAAVLVIKVISFIVSLLAPRRRR